MHSFRPRISSWVCGLQSSKHATDSHCYDLNDSGRILRAEGKHLPVYTTLFMLSSFSFCIYQCRLDGGLSMTPYNRCPPHRKHIASYSGSLY